jgi:hypothetical protein
MFHILYLLLSPPYLSVRDVLQVFTRSIPDFTNVNLTINFRDTTIDLR